MRARGLGPDLPRDRAVLIRLARQCLLSLSQIHQLVFAGLDRSRVSRRLGKLARQGWLTLWEQPVDRGGRPRYAAPTAAGLRWALDRITAETAPFPYARLIATMLRRGPRRPLPLTRGVVPPHLAHLREVNDVLISLQLDRAAGVVWVSSWNRPLPISSHGVHLPQPDGVVIRRGGNAPILHFLEHDRGVESLEQFRTRKVDRYRELARRPGLVSELTGVPGFRVCVTVRTGKSSSTAARIAALRRCAQTRLAGPLFTFVGADLGVPPAHHVLGDPDAIDTSGCDGLSRAEAV